MLFLYLSYHSVPGMGRRRRFAFSENWKRRRRWRAASQTSIRYVGIFFEQALDIFAFLWILFQKSIFGPYTVVNSERISYSDFLTWAKNAILPGNYQKFWKSNSKRITNGKRHNDITISFIIINSDELKTKSIKLQRFGKLYELIVFEPHLNAVVIKTA